MSEAGAEQAFAARGRGKWGGEANYPSFWRDLARRHERDPDKPGATPFLLFNRIADVFAQALADMASRPYWEVA